MKDEEAGWRIADNIAKALRMEASLDPYVCGNCGSSAKGHVDGKCLFDAASYEPVPGWEYVSNAAKKAIPAVIAAIRTREPKRELYDVVAVEWLRRMAQHGQARRICIRETLHLAQLIDP